ncbi:hypothetical protein HK104_003957 [Borealophlyctis nickersoniae]|nr:hypothetical protein HK104_003957 [Borealophlyctis nickersoniae]
MPIHSGKDSKKSTQVALPSDKLRPILNYLSFRNLMRARAVSRLVKAEAEVVLKDKYGWRGIRGVPPATVRLALMGIREEQEGRRRKGSDLLGAMKVILDAGTARNSSKVGFFGATSQR